MGSAAVLGVLVQAKGIAKTTRGLRQVDSAVAETAQVADRAAVDMGQAGEKGGGRFAAGISKGAEKAKDAVKVGAAAIGAALVGGLINSINVEAANDKLAAQLGVSGKRAKDLGKIAGGLYADAYGESLADVNTALKSVLQAGLLPEDATNKQIKSITAKVLDLSTAFDQDLAGSTRAVGALMRNGLAKDANQALDIVTRGFQQGVDKSGDYLDTLNEYSPLFNRLGLDGAQATGLLSQGLKAGARDADTVADALKEFQIRATDGSTASAAGFKALGLNAGDMTAAIAKGGPAAEKGLGTVLKRLREMEDPVERNKAAVALFGTKAEDLGASLFALDPTTAVDGLGQVAGAAQKMGDTLNDNTSVRLEAAKRTAVAFATTLGGMLLSAIFSVVAAVASIVGWFRKHETVTLALGAAAGVVTAALVTMRVVALAQMIPMLARTAAAWVLMNLAMLANPAVLIVVALAALAAGLVVAYRESETFRAIVMAVWNAIKVAIGAAIAFIVPVITTAWNAIKAVTSVVWGAIKAVIGVVWAGIKAYVTVALAVITAVVTTAWTVIKAVTTTVWNVIKSVITLVWAGIKAYVTAALTVIKAIITTAWTVISAVTSAVWGVISKVIGAVWAVIKAVVTTALGIIVPVITAAWNTVAYVTKAIWSLIRGILEIVWALIKVAVTTVFNAILRQITIVWNAVAAVTKTVWNAIKTVLGAVWSAIKSALTAVFNVYKAIITTAWNAIKSVTTSVWGAIKAALTTVWNAIKSLVTAALDILKSRITAVWGALKSTTTTAWAGIRTAIINPVRSAAGWVIDKVKWLAEALQAGFRSIWGIATDFAGGLKDRIVSAFKGVVNKIGGFINKIISIVNKIPGVDIGYKFTPLAQGGQFSAAGVDQRLARGGMVSRPTVLVGEERGHPEYVIPTNPAYRGRATALMASAAQKMGMEGFARGGVLGNADTFASVAKKMGAGAKSTLALFMAGVVESGMRNLSYGDRDSRGILQIRDGTARGMGINNMSVAQSAAAFLGRGFWNKGSAMSLSKSGMSAGQVAQNTQGSAYPAAYDQQRGRALGYLKAAKGDKKGLGDLLKGALSAAGDVASALNPMDFISKLPGVGDLPGWIQGLGKHAISGVSKWIKDKVASIIPSGGGGGGGGSTTGLTDRVKDAVSYARSNGWSGGINSGFRSKAKQQALYDAYKSGRGNLAAPPGNSNHERGLAVDVSQPDQFARAMGRMGEGRLYRKVPGEPWHFSTTGYAQGGVLDGARKAMTSPFVGSYATGGIVPRDGIAKVHKGERVTPPGRSDGPMVHIENYNVTDAAHDEERLARKVGFRMRALGAID